MRKIIALVVFVVSFLFFIPSGVQAGPPPECGTVGSGGYVCNSCWGDICMPVVGCEPAGCCSMCRCCGVGEGDGSSCVVCTRETKCRRYDNCPGSANNQGGHCGYTKTRPVVEKRWCSQVTECHNICNTCTTTAPDTPILLSPANGTQIRKLVDTTFSWNAVGNWGANCTDPNNSYNFCISSGVGSCDLVDEDALSTETQGVWKPTEGNPNVTWSVTANNGALTSTSAVGNICVEGFNIGDPSYLSNWGDPGSGNICSRTCREDCGTDDCAGQALTKICNLGPWWQVKDSDVQSASDLISMVPPIPGTFFNLAGPGGFPGVSAYGGSTNLTGANVASTGWLAESPVTNARVYNYDYFVNQIPSDILAIMNNINIADVVGSLTSGGTHDANNYYWYKYDGSVNSNLPLTIPATDIGTRKVILLVDNANVNITGDVNLTDGQGFFMLVVKGNIDLDPAVGGGGSPNLEGFYFADGTITDGVGDTQLSTRGSMVANGGIRMQRGSGTDNTQPSEFFEFAPDQIMLFPKVFGTRKMNWKEVAP